MSSTPVPARGTERPWRVWVAACVPFVLAFTVLGCWALASPAGSSPDDNFHLPSIWCAGGDNPDSCAVLAERPGERAVPDELIEAPCFAFDSSRSAECQAGSDGKLGPEYATASGNWTGLYPPLFYRAMNVFVVGGLGESVVLMRLFNSALLLAVVAALGLLLPRPLRSVAPMALLVTSVPLALSIYPSTNPSSWTLISAGTFWIALHGSFDVTGRRRVGLLALAVLLSVVGAGSRADGGLFVALGIATVAVLRWRALVGPRGARLAGLRTHADVCAVALVTLLVAAWGYLSADQSSAVTTGLAQAPAADDGLALLWYNVTNLPAILFGSAGIGMGAMGWLDTPVPWAAACAAFAVLVAVVFTSWRWLSRTRMAALALVGLAAAGYPLYLLQQSGAIVGTQFQPRYVLPAIVVFVGVGLLGLRLGYLTRLQRWVLVVALAMAQSLSLFAQIRRYVTGLDVTSPNLGADVEWWWSDGAVLTPLTTWIAGSLAFAALAWWILARERGGPAESLVPARPDIR